MTSKAARVTLPDGTLLTFAHADEAQAFAGVPHLVTGIGIVNAMAGLADAIAAHDVTRVVVLGTAGIIDDTLNLETVYRVREAVQHDFGFEPPRAHLDASGAVQVTGVRRGAALEREQRADVAAPHAIAESTPTAVIATGDTFVSDDAVKAALIQSGVHLVDMECYGYAAICAALGVSLEIYKVPSDFADSATTDETWDEIVHRKSEQLLGFARTRGLL